MNALRKWIWLIWLPIAIWLFAPQFREQLGPQAAHPVYRIVALIAIAAMIPVWLAIRKRWRWADVALLTLAILPALVRAPLAALVMGAMLAAAFGIGTRVCLWLKLELPGPSLQFLLPVAIGLGIWIVILMAQAVVGRLDAALVSVAILLCAGATTTPIFRVIG